MSQFSNQTGQEPAEKVAVEDLIPLAVIATETGLGVDNLAHRFSGVVVLDDVGMRSISVDVARQFFAQRRAQKARFDEDARRRSAERAGKAVRVKGAPAMEGASAMESLIAAEAEIGAYSTPSDDYGRGWGSPTRVLMDEQFAAGATRIAERRRRAAERTAERKAGNE